MNTFRSKNGGFMTHKAALLSLGCKVNSYETERIREDLVEKGFEIVDFDEIADVYIINTCSVTNIADRKSRQMLHRAKSLNPDAVIVATGCYVQTEKDKEKLNEVADILIGNNHKGEIADEILKYFSDVSANIVTDKTNAVSDIENADDNVIGNDKKGRIYIDYYSRDDLDRISTILNKVDKGF